MSFVGDYDEYYSNKKWKKECGSSYTEFIQNIIKKHAPNGVFLYNDEPKRGHFCCDGFEYTIRTWTVNQQGRGWVSSYSIFRTEPQQVEPKPDCYYLNNIPNDDLPTEVQ
jgi:hypothetical protein